MKLDTSFTLTEENFPQQASWIGNLLGPLSNRINSILQALSGNLSIGDNVIGIVQQVSFTTSATYNTGTFTAIRLNWIPGNRKLPQTVLVGKVIATTVPTTAVTAHNWTYDAQSSAIIVNYVSGLANSTTYTITLECK